MTKKKKGPKHFCVETRYNSRDGGCEELLRALQKAVALIRKGKRGAQIKIQFSDPESDHTSGDVTRNLDRRVSAALAHHRQEGEEFCYNARRIPDTYIYMVDLYLG